MSWEWANWGNRAVAEVGTRNKVTREEWIRNALASLPAGWRILDAGAGQQPYREWCDHLEYVAQDFAQYDGQGDGKGLQKGARDYCELDIVSDIARIPEPDASFDAVLCTEVLEHVPRPRAALREFHRLLRDGGTLILTAPFCSLTHYAPYHFFTGFSRYFHERALPEIGFDIEEVVPNGSFFEYMAQELRRLPRVAQEHAATRPPWLVRRALRRLMAWLATCCERDAGSHELLCYGYHVRARKRASE